jgi:hypothetical protein
LHFEHEHSAFSGSVLRILLVKFHEKSSSTATPVYVSEEATSIARSVRVKEIGLVGYKLSGNRPTNLRGTEAQLCRWNLVSTA